MRLLIFGTGGHARVVAEAVEAERNHVIVGFVNEDGSTDGLSPLTYPVVAGNADFAEKAHGLGAEGFVIALGDSDARERLQALAGRHLVPVTICHPSAVISPSATLGPGTVVLAGSIINAGTRIGSGVIVNTRSSVDHDCHLGDFVHISPGATLAGRVTVQARAWIGTGCIVTPGVSIGEGALVVAGSVVTKDVSPRTRYIGGRLLPREDQSAR